jgi:hypothetical protein
MDCETAAWYLWHGRCTGSKHITLEQQKLLFPFVRAIPVLRNP